MVDWNWNKFVTDNPLFVTLFLGALLLVVGTLTSIEFQGVKIGLKENSLLTYIVAATGLLLCIISLLLIIINGGGKFKEQVATPVAVAPTAQAITSGVQTTAPVTTASITTIPSTTVALPTATTAPTPIPPTATAVPPTVTNTPVPPTATAVPPTPTNTPLPTPTFTSAPPVALKPDTILFEDNFLNNGTGQKTDWIYDGFGTDIKRWQVVNKQFTVSGDIAGSDDGTALARPQKPINFQDWQNYSVDVSVTNISGWTNCDAVAFSCLAGQTLVLVRFQNTSNYAALWISTGEMRWYIYTRGKASGTPTSSKRGKPSANAQLHIEVKNSSLYATDGTTDVSIISNDVPPYGGIGLRLIKGLSESGTLLPVQKANFSNLIVKQL